MFLLTIVAVGAIIGLYGALAYGGPLFGEYAWVLALLSMALFIWAAVSRRPSWGNRLLGSPVLGFIGRISYSMYLYHLPLLLLFNKYASSALVEFAFPCYFVIVVGLSAISFRYVEQPFIRGKAAQSVNRHVSAENPRNAPTEAGRGPN